MRFGFHDMSLIIASEPAAYVEPIGLWVELEAGTLSRFFVCVYITHYIIFVVLVVELNARVQRHELKPDYFPRVELLFWIFSCFMLSLWTIRHAIVHSYFSNTFNSFSYVSTKQRL